METLHSLCVQDVHSKRGNIQVECSVSRGEYVLTGQYPAVTVKKILEIIYGTLHFSWFCLFF